MASQGSSRLYIDQVVKCSPLSNATNYLQGWRLALSAKTIPGAFAFFHKHHHSAAVATVLCAGIANEIGLSYIPIAKFGFCLQGTYKEALALKYRWTPSHSQSCDCGSTCTFTVEHGLSCPSGGFPINRNVFGANLRYHVKSEDFIFSQQSKTRYCGCEWPKSYNSL